MLILLLRKKQKFINANLGAKKKVIYRNHVTLKITLGFVYISWPSDLPTTTTPAHRKVIKTFVLRIVF